MKEDNNSNLGYFLKQHVPEAFLLWPYYGWVWCCVEFSWSMASVSVTYCHTTNDCLCGLGSGGLWCPHNTAVGFPHSEWFMRESKKKLPCLCDQVYWSHHVISTPFYELQASQLVCSHSAGRKWVTPLQRGMSKNFETYIVWHLYNDHFLLQNLLLQNHKHVLL